MPFELVVDGTDGAGKTVCIAALKQNLEASGYSPAVCAPYREQEVYPLWENEPHKAARIIRDIMENFRKINCSHDLILWDRGWPTAFITTKNYEARELFKPFPPLTILLLNSQQRTREKAEALNLKGVWVRDPLLIDKYNRAYHDLELPEKTIRLFPCEKGLFDFPAVYRMVKPLLPPL